MNFSAVDNTHSTPLSPELSSKAGTRRSTLSDPVTSESESAFLYVSIASSSAPSNSLSTVASLFLNAGRSSKPDVPNTHSGFTLENGIVQCATRAIEPRRSTISRGNSAFELFFCKPKSKHNAPRPRCEYEKPRARVTTNPLPAISKYGSETKKNLSILPVASINPWGTTDRGNIIRSCVEIYGRRKLMYIIFSVLQSFQQFYSSHSHR